MRACLIHLVILMHAPNICFLDRDVLPLKGLVLSLKRLLHIEILDTCSDHLILVRVHCCRSYELFTI